MLAARSFAISMAIAIAATQTQVHGFTIRGRHTTVEPGSDLTEEASSVLEVKYDVGRKDVEQVSADPNDVHTEVIAINKTENDHISNGTRYNLLEPNSTDINQYTTESAVNVTVLSIVENKDIDNRTVISKEETKANITVIDETTTYNTISMTKIAPDNEVGSEILNNVNLVIASTIFDNITTESVPTASETSTVEYSEEPETSSLSLDGSTTLTGASSSSTSFDYMYEPETTNTGSNTSDSYTATVDDNSSYSDITEATTYTSTPTWKKYTTIDRGSATTNRDALHVPDNDNMLKSETAQTRITLENIISMTPIPSLENLRQRFTSMNDDQLMPKILEDTYDVSGVPSKSALNTSTEAPVAKIGMVSSRRGGYLDNTGTSTPHSIEATTVQMKNDNTSYTETYGALYETETSDSVAPEHKNTSGVESQSQLVEDAIQEELLKEETINDNKENANRYSDTGGMTSSDKANKSSSQAAAELSSHDALSVKPIISDKKINASLYAVHPNYKPLKKIDVQPPKQFVRDPDDNSWRNESISSLGIVFKPKNSTKSFTQVLKNKTETELNSTSEKDNKVPDLRVRLEKIAEVRKSKKKKTNQFGEVVYTDYDSGETTNPPTNVTTLPVTSFLDSLLSVTTPQTPNVDTDLSVNIVKKEKIDIFNIKDPSLLTTTKPKKYFNIAEYYDTTDEYDADYMKVTKIDLKKFTKPIAIKAKLTTPPPGAVYPTQLSNYLPERRPTVQYFPPTKKVTQKMNVEDYDTNFQSKLDLYTNRGDPKNVLPVSYGTASPSHTDPTLVSDKPELTPIYKHNMDKNLYMTHPPGGTEPRDGYAVIEGNFNRASYVIKHYKDFINEAIKDNDEDRNIDYLPFTESPVRGVTVNELAKLTEKDARSPEEDYEYELQYRKHLINRFVDHFNQNSDRFKVDFPILYNNSIVHRKIAADGGKALASSSAYLRRQYGAPDAAGVLSNTKSCEPNCDKVNVDLSPDYELHYYVPEQEEKEEIDHDHRHITVPYRYRNTQL